MRVTFSCLSTCLRLQQDYAHTTLSTSGFHISASQSKTSSTTDRQIRQHELYACRGEQCHTSPQPRPINAQSLRPHTGPPPSIPPAFFRGSRTFCKSPRPPTYPARLFSVESAAAEARHPPHRLASHDHTLNISLDCRDVDPAIGNISAGLRGAARTCAG